MRPAVDPSAEFINGRESCRIIDCAASSLQRAALLGDIRTLIVPGRPIMYHRDDVLRCAEIRRAQRAIRAVDELQSIGV
jgi:hypothetical protein